MALTNDLKIDTLKYPTLNEDELTVHINDKQHVYLIHNPTHIEIDADSRHTLQENWDFAQKALSAALEHRAASDTGAAVPDDQYTG